MIANNGDIHGLLANLPSGGQGGVLPTSDDHHTRADLALVGRAVRQRWGVPDSVRKELPEAMRSIVLNDDPENTRERVAAAKVLVAMEAQNQADDHAEDKNARLDGGQSTENVVHMIPAPTRARVVDRLVIHAQSPTRARVGAGIM